MIRLRTRNCDSYFGSDISLPRSFNCPRISLSFEKVIEVTRSEFCKDNIIDFHGQQRHLVLPTLSGTIYPRIYFAFPTDPKVNYMQNLVVLERNQRTNRVWCEYVSRYFLPVHLLDPLDHLFFYFLFTIAMDGDNEDASPHMLKGLLCKDY
jgi:hypothetical protein